MKFCLYILFTLHKTVRTFMLSIYFEQKFLITGVLLYGYLNMVIYFFHPNLESVESIMAVHLKILVYFSDWNAKSS